MWAFQARDEFFTRDNWALYNQLLQPISDREDRIPITFIGTFAVSTTVAAIPAGFTFCITALTVSGIATGGVPFICSLFDGVVAERLWQFDGSQGNVSDALNNDIIRFTSTLDVVLAGVGTFNLNAQGYLESNAPIN